MSSKRLKMYKNTANTNTSSNDVNSPEAARQRMNGSDFINEVLILQVENGNISAA
ncbi:MAG: hypothetical protein AseanaTS_31200 [Candidatus Pelagadaptatus aseana]